jgi:hypothetical protein
VLANFPARLLDPFIHVWPAIALTVEGPLGDFVSRWSRSMLALIEEDGAGSLRGDVGVPASPAPAPAPAPAHEPSGQPAFSWVPPPSAAPFNWIGSESALVVVALLIALATATLTIMGLARRELGLPMLRRGNRFPWRH